MPARDGCRDLITDGVSKNRRMTGACADCLADARTNIAGPLLVVQKCNVLFPREANHYVQVAFKCTIQKPDRRNGVSANSIDATTSHQPKVPLDLPAVMKFHAALIRTERAVGHTTNPKLVVAGIKKLSADARTVVPRGSRRLVRDSLETIGGIRSQHSATSAKHLYRFPR